MAFTLATIAQCISQGLGGGGGSLSFTTATVSVPYNVQHASVTVVDAAISSSSKILVGWGTTLPTDENTPDMQQVTFMAVPATGQMTVELSVDALGARLGGPYKIQYAIGA